MCSTLLTISVTNTRLIGSGIGHESALTFAERGARVVVFADLDLDAATAASEQSRGIATAEGYETLAIRVDVRDRGSVRSMIEEVKKRFGRLDYAVNSAGVSGTLSVGWYD